MSLLSEHEKAWGNPPIFDQYEFYIQLADEREESRISALITQYNGKIALQKGRKSTTHVTSTAWTPRWKHTIGWFRSPQTGFANV